MRKNLRNYVINYRKRRTNMKSIKDAVQYYKNNIDKYWKNEKYKWVALQWYKTHWNINSADFFEMYEESFSKASNLLSGGMYHPRKMILHFAEFKPEKVKNLFELLLNEELPLQARLQPFRNGCVELLQEYVERTGSQKAKSHYQDLRALCVYLSFQYPDKYFLYKSRMYKGFAAKVGYKEISQNSDSELRKLENFNDLCQKVVDEILKDQELINMQNERVSGSDGCYDDKSLHLLAQTIMYVYSGEYGEVDDNGESSDGDEFGPLYDDYQIDISKEDWKKFLYEIEYPYHKGCMRVLKCFVDIGGIASPKKLSDTYKGHPSVYTSSVTNTCRRALRYFEAEAYSDSSGNWLFPIAFLWKNAKENEPGLIVYKMRDELMDAIKEMSLDDIDLEYKKEKDKTSKSGLGLNTILYGPPGTGKTYHTAYYAVSICDDIPIEEVIEWNIDDVLARYEILKEQENRIAFTTFHQSYGYEEFIEGIRPVMEDESTDESYSVSKELKYEVKPGTFKKFCDLARNSYMSESNIDWGLNDNPTVWKVSLEGAGDNETRTECLENGHIRIGWDEYGPDITRETNYQYGGKVILNAFYNKMKKGDIVISCYSSELTDAIGVITGDAEWNPSFKYYERVRKVNWLVKGIRENIVKINENKPMVLASVYKMDVSSEDALNIVKKYIDNPEKSADKKNYVFIIDEINRGNISKIFGELITLIEKSKREGAKEKAEVILPYSNKPFSVPDNVYILGTMNTADRSIALMDTALRRRFQFVEMMPRLDVIKDLLITEGDVSINVSDMLGIINKRIEFLYDREHTIGHAFFIPLLDKEKPKVSDLGLIFKKSIIPLLQEYFYEDYEKIRLVLGDNAKKDKDIEFIVAVPPEKDLFRGNVTDEDYKDYIYQINNNAFSDIRSYKGISEKL